MLQELENIGIVPAIDMPQEATIGKRIRKMVIIGSKSDLDNAGVNWSQLKSRYNNKLPMVSISAIEGNSLEGLRKEIFQALEVIRVHTKQGKGKPLSRSVNRRTHSLLAFPPDW